MDYKNTLNLPRTSFPMKADLVDREPRMIEEWSGLYEKIQARRAGAPKFILHDGPPFANGDVHIGTAQNKILKDFIVKYKTLRGKQAPFVPGWDCHGLPIEFRVVQDLRKKGGEAGASAVDIRKACETYALSYVDIQRKQFQRLGVLGDWGNPYLTLKPSYEAMELRLFADLIDKGFVYRGKKPVYWSIPCRTALAEAEVEYKDHVSPSVYVKFPVADREGTYVVIWTTTPWTLPANLAIAYNPNMTYTLVMSGKESYIVCVPLLNTVAEKCGWEGYQIVRSLHAEELACVQCRHPFIDRDVPLLPGSFVESTTGTGFVHIAPGHGLEDYQLGKQSGLPVYSPVDDNGCLCHTRDLPVERQMPLELIGKSILEHNGKSEANEAVLQLLQSKDILLRREDYTHSYPHCWRSKTPVIFRAMDQWFIRIDHENFRDKALSAINGVAWTPGWGQNRIESAVKSRPDWCISRQRCWGVPIPAFYDDQGEPILDGRIVRATADLVEKHGSNVWFEQTAAQLWAQVKPSNWSGREPAAKSTDTLDVWIDSGSSSRSVLMATPVLNHSESANGAPAWQADLYLEGSDQHRGWFQSSLLLSLAGNGAPPYKSVLTHGFIVDADREKISKSKQSGYQKPQTSDAYVKKYGADVLRLWVSSQDCTNDIIVSDERISKAGETYRGIRNALRYQLSNLFDFDPARDTVSESQLTGLDRWILDACARIEEQVATAYEASQFHVVYQAVSQFVAVELSAVYHDVVKDRLYTDKAGSARRRSTQTALYRLARSLCQMLSPVMAFTADEAWRCLPGAVPGDSVHSSDWTPSAFVCSEEQRQTWAKLFELREKVLPALEKARQEKLIGKALEAKVELGLPPQDHALISGNIDALRELLNVSGLALKESQEPTVSIGRAEGQKCERCWHWETTVGTQNDHPTLCSRCADAVKA